VNHLKFTIYIQSTCCSPAIRSVLEILHFQRSCTDGHADCGSFDSRQLEMS